MDPVHEQILATEATEANVFAGTINIVMTLAMMSLALGIAYYLFSHRRPC